MTRYDHDIDRVFSFRVMRACDACVRIVQRMTKVRPISWGKMPEHMRVRIWASHEQYHKEFARLGL